VSRKQPAPGSRASANLAASAVVGVLYTVALPSIAFAYASVLMPIAVVLLLGANRRVRSSSAELVERVG
jgi:hypothetical protein